MKRNTIQRALVLEAVNTLRCHATADEIYEAIAARYPTISRGTVYRNLKLLCESGDIRKIETMGGSDRYDHRCHDHYHARCNRCGRVFDIEMPYLAGLEAQIQDAHGFLVSGHDILFRGICPLCQAQEKQQP